MAARGGDARGFRNVQAVTWSEGIAFEMVPAAKLFDGDVESIGDGNECVAFAGDIPRRTRSGRTADGGNRNNQCVDARDIGGVAELIDKGDLCRADAISVGDCIERFSRHDAMKAPRLAAIDWNFGDAFAVEIFRAGWKMKIKSVVGWRSHSEQTGIERDDLLYRSLDNVSDEAEVDTVVGHDGIGEQWRIEDDSIEAVLLGIFRHDCGGQDDGNIILGFLRKGIAAIEFPEVSVPGALHGALDVPGAPVVRGHGEIPVAELFVEILDVPGVGAG